MSTLCDLTKFKQSRNPGFCKPTKGHGKLGANNKASKLLMISKDQIFEQWPFPFMHNMNGSIHDGLWSTWTYPVKKLKTNHIFGILIELVGCSHEGWARNAYYGLLDIIQHGSEKQLIEGLKYGGIQGFRKLFANSPHISDTWDGFAAGLDLLERLLTCTSQTRKLCIEGFGLLIRPISRIYKIREQHPIYITYEDTLAKSAVSNGRTKSKCHSCQPKVINGNCDRSKKSLRLTPQAINQVLGGAPQLSYEPEFESWLLRIETLVSISCGPDSQEYCRILTEIKRWCPTYESLQYDSKCAVKLNYRRDPEQSGKTRRLTNPMRRIARKSPSIASSHSSIYRSSRIHSIGSRVPRYGPLPYISGPAPQLPGSGTCQAKLIEIAEPEPSDKPPSLILTKCPSHQETPVTHVYKESPVVELQSTGSSSSFQFDDEEIPESPRRSVLKRKANSIVYRILSGVETKMTMTKHGLASHQVHSESGTTHNEAPVDEEHSEPSNDGQMHSYTLPNNSVAQHHHDASEQSEQKESVDYGSDRRQSRESFRKRHSKSKHRNDTEDLALIEDLESMQTEFNGEMEDEYSVQDTHLLKVREPGFDRPERSRNESIENNQVPNDDSREVYYDFRVVESSAVIGPSEMEMGEQGEKHTVTRSSFPPPTIPRQQSEQPQQQERERQQPEQPQQYRQPGQEHQQQQQEDENLQRERQERQQQLKEDDERELPHNPQAIQQDDLHEWRPIKITRIATATQDEDKDEGVRTTGPQLTIRHGPTTRIIEVDNLTTSEGHQKAKLKPVHVSAASDADSSEQISGWSTLVQTGSDEITDLSTDGVDRYVFRIHTSQTESERNVKSEETGEPGNLAVESTMTTNNEAPPTGMSINQTEASSLSTPVHKTGKAAADQDQEQVEDMNEQHNQGPSGFEHSFLVSSKKEETPRTRETDKTRSEIKLRKLYPSHDFAPQTSAEEPLNSLGSPITSPTSPVTFANSPQLNTNPSTVTSTMQDPQRPSSVDASVGPGSNALQLIRLHVNVQARASCEDGELPCPIVIDTQVTTTPPTSVDTDYGTSVLRRSVT